MHYDKYKYSDTKSKYTNTNIKYIYNYRALQAVNRPSGQEQGKPGRPGALRAGPYYYYESLGLCPKMQNFLSSAAFT